MQPSPLPPELRGLAIRTSTGADHDVTPRRLRAADVDHPFHGVSAFEVDTNNLLGRCRAFLPVMEDGQVFSHSTALALHGAPLPRQLDELHVSVAFPRTPPRRPGIRGHSLVSAPGILLGELPTSPPLVAWAQSATLLNREDLVAVGDHLVRRDPAAFLELAHLVGSWVGRPGCARLGWAAPRVRLGVRSRPETHLRLLLVSARLPEPVVAHPVVVADGRVVVHPDLCYPGARLAIEYEGGRHRDPRQWEVDIERRELLAEAGWRTIRITTTQLYCDPRGVVARVIRHLR